MIPFERLYDRARESIESAYGVRVMIRAFAAGSFTGDLNGVEIHIADSVDAELRLFLLGHLFGHTVQWNTDPATIALGLPRKPPVDQSILPALMIYERQAAEYGLWMFHGAAITGVDQWFSDYTACDMAYLKHYYETGKKDPVREFWRSNTDPVTPRVVPAFAARKLIECRDGVVI
jgi:hypothetical protein